MAAHFTGRTPEAQAALIGRSDSRNPATTCKGLTKGGTPCRRAIDAKDPRGGVVAVASVTNDSDEEDEGAAAFFCWQHKDQAEQLIANNASGPKRTDTRLFTLHERNSIDSLVARLGVLDVGDSEPKQRKRKDGSNRPPRRINRPPTWNQVQGPLMSVPSDVMAGRWNRPDYQPEERPQRKERGFWTSLAASLCCGSADDDYMEVVKHKRRQDQQNASAVPPMSEAPRPRPSNSSAPNSAARPATSSSKKRNPSDPSSYVPSSLPPQVASNLLAELSKPISEKDEDGYIYIFWLTPESSGPAPSSTASSLLNAPARPEQGRRTSDVLRQHSVRQPQRNRSRDPSASAPDADDKNTILLKIGRANNVTRRMNEWTRQCGYNLSLVRYYPYVSSTPTPSPQASPANSRQASYNKDASQGVRKVPYAHRVERLIHIELANSRMIKKCEACGRTHQEWFEVEATRDGVKGVDEVIKRWVDWAEKKA